MAVEQLDFRKDNMILGDGICSIILYESFIGHPDAKIFFGHLPGTEFFNSHACAQQLTSKSRSSLEVEQSALSCQVAQNWAPRANRIERAVRRYGREFG